MDKLKFWKKEEDEFELDKELGMPGEAPRPGALPGEEYGLGPTPGEPGALGGGPLGVEKPELGLPQKQEPRITPALQQAPPVTGATREMEVLNLKLDSIRNTLETINIRLERIERLARGEEHHPPPKQW